MQARRAWGVGLGVGVALIMAFALYVAGPQASWLPECLFHRFTGLSCPGCGMTRAAHATLHGRLGEAFRLNPVGMVLFPLALLGIGFELIGWVRGRPFAPKFRLGGGWAWGIVGVVLAFWILRNVPFWPCTLLAPP